MRLRENKLRFDRIHRLSLETLEARRVFAAVPFSSLPPLESSDMKGFRNSAFGDLDGDGLTDIVSYSAVSNQLVLFTNEGGLSFSEPVEIAREGVSFFELSDLDGDDDLDVVFLSGGESYAWLENVNSSEQFSRRSIGIDVDLATHTWVIDVNGDGLDDLLSQRTHAVAIHHNQGNGIFRHADTLQVPFGSVTEFADVDDDGDVDFIFSTTQGISQGISWTENDQGQFNTTTELTNGLIFPSQIVAGDFDGDTDTDILVVAPMSLVLEQTDNGEFIEHSLDVSLSDTMAADLFEGGGQELFADNFDSVSIYTVSNAFAAQQTVVIEAEFEFVDLVDLDHDGDLDLVETDPGASEIRFFENRDSEFAEPILLFDPDNFDEPTTPQFVDWDGDSDLDILATSPHSGEVVWYEYDALNRSFSGRQTIVDGVTLNRYVGVHDLDNDGKLDLVLAPDYGFRLVWIQNTGDPFDIANAVEIPKPALTVGISKVLVTDLDNDTYLDIAVSYAGRIGWVHNDGNGNFSPLQQFASNVGDEFELADLDGDGMLDFVGIDNNTQFAIWQKQVTPGVFSGAENLGSIEFDSDTVVVADIDGDGVQEPAFVGLRQSNGAGLPYWFNRDENEDWQFDFISLDGHRVTDLIFSDVDGDGDEDLVSGSTGLRWYGNLDDSNRFGIENVVASESLDAVSILAADFDVDGDNDYLIYSSREDVMFAIRNELISQSIRGDLNTDGRISPADIDILNRAIRDKRNQSEFDIDLSGLVDENDRRVFLTTIAQTSVGDANFDGLFDSGDLVRMFQSGGYEKADVAATWESGDFNGDGRFTTADLVAAFQDGKYVR